MNLLHVRVQLPPTTEPCSFTARTFVAASFTSLLVHIPPHHILRLLPLQPNRVIRPFPLKGATHSNSYKMFISRYFSRL